MSEWAPIFRGDDFDFDFWLEDEDGEVVPLSDVSATLGEIELGVTDFAGADAGKKFHVSLPGDATEPLKDTKDLTDSSVTLCVHVTYTDGRKKTAIRETVDVEAEC